MSNLSVVIPFRNEKMLDFTIKRARKTAESDLEIIVVDDGSDEKISYSIVEKIITLSQPVGNCYARHLGVCDASNDAVVVIDSHMNFLNGWDQRLLQWYENNSKKIISCFRCPVLNKDDMEMTEGRKEYHAARIKWKDISCGRRRLLPNKWYNYQAPCQVSCLLGGAYLLSKNWYQTLGGPWKYMRGWGHSEQIITIVNYLLGGENWLAEEPIGHMFRTGKYNEVPYRTLLSNLYYNQHVVAEVCIDQKKDKQELLDYIKIDEQNWRMTAVIKEKIKNNKVEILKQHVQINKKRNWEDYKKEWIYPYKKLDNNK